MLRNHLKLAWRNLTRRPGFSSINLLGLTAGLASAIVMMTYISYEWQFDRFHTQADRIYRVINDRFQEGELIQHGTITYSPVGPQMEEDFPEVVGHARVMMLGEQIITVGETPYDEEDLLFTDGKFLEVFDFPLLAGDPEQCLEEPQSIVLTQSVAERFFGTPLHEDWASFVGKEVFIGPQRGRFTITGVMEDVPAYSHLDFSMLVSFKTLKMIWGPWVETSWRSSDFWHYVLLAEHATEEEVEAKLPAFSEQHFKGEEVSGSEERFSLQPLTEAHLKSDFEYEIGRTSDGDVVNALFLVAIFVLLIAWINYINLTTTRAMERAKEVGVRKVLGAQRSALISQFMAEAVLFNGLAIGMAIILAELCLPLLSQYLKVSLSLASLAGDVGLPVSLGLGLVGLSVLGTLLSGMYPAWVISGFQPITVLKGKLQHRNQGRWLRRGLVIFQFACAIGLVIATITVYQQVQFMQSQELGVNLEQTMVVEGPELTPWDSTFIDRADQFLHALEGIPGVQAAATSSRVPGNRLGRVFGIEATSIPGEESLAARQFGANHRFLETYQIPLVTGRNFTPSDHHFRWNNLSSILINMHMVERLGLEHAEDAIGKSLHFWSKDWKVVGVFGNFHQVSLQYPIESMIILPTYSTDGQYSLHLQGELQQAQLAQIKETYEEFFPGNLFEYSFVEDRFRAQYLSEKQMGELFGGFAGLALLIGCLGLFGLASYTTLQRSKEIGVRKVLGASMKDLVFLLGREWSILLLVAIIIGTPIVWWGLQGWLDGYAFRVSIQPGWIILAAAVVCLCAGLAVGMQTLKTIRMNPAEVLQDE